MSRPASGPSTRAVHAGLAAPRQGAPLLDGPVLAAPYHLAGDPTPESMGYGRDANPTWAALEAGIGELEGGEAVAFASGMAAVTAAVLPLLEPGDALVVPEDGYPGVRALADERLAPLGVEVRRVPSRAEAFASAAEGARLVWVETPSNPWLDVVDLAAVAAAARAAGAWLAVDNTVATPLGQRPLALGADLSVLSATKSLAGHSDLLLGSVATRDPGLLAGLRRWRSQTGSVPGPFEAWLAHRSLATLELRLARQGENATALAAWLRERPGVDDVRHPGASRVARTQMRHFGPLVAFTLAGRAVAERFLAGLELVADATSFGGVHSTAERRGRWGTDAVPPGFVRLAAGCEDLADLREDLDRALARAGVGG